MNIDPSAVLDFANKLTIVGLLTLDLVVVVVGLQRKWWVPYWVYREKAESEANWRAIAMRGATITERAVGIAEVTIPPALGTRTNGSDS